MMMVMSMSSRGAGRGLRIQGRKVTGIGGGLKLRRQIVQERGGGRIGLLRGGGLQLLQLLEQGAHLREIDLIRRSGG
jgi:hypothetical protein